MNIVFRKTILFIWIVVLGVAVMPTDKVSAAGEYEPPVPPTGQEQLSTERLERIWARQLRIYDRIRQRFEHDEAFIERAQSLIDRAEASGKELSAVQAALDAFEAALRDAHPMYQSANGIVSSHLGFDEEGKVTDAARAQETVHAMRDKLKEIKDAMGGTGKALREALRAFREANLRLQSTPIP